MKKEKNIIAFVMNLPVAAAESLREYSQVEEGGFRIMVIWDSRVRRERQYKKADFVVECDFSKPDKIAAALQPFQDELLAITCRSEQYAPRFAAAIPHVPYLRTPTTESIFWATDKLEMRKRLKRTGAKFSPKFTRVKVNSKTERKRVIEKIGFPMIIKPTNLAASLFVTICYHEDELEQTLRQAFRSIKKAYALDKRMEEPKVIAEEYMEGDMYSIDSYTNSRGKVYHCPLVSVKTGKNIGHDDFYNYLQMTPTALKRTTVENAELATEKAIHALGLRNTTTHTELMKVDDEWKIIEIGPRSGGFRDFLYSASCDIKHSLNDVFVRIPKKPIIPKKCKGFSAAMKWFPEKEGKITEMKGIKKIEQLASFDSITINKKIGDKVKFARNGGRSVFNVFLYNESRAKLLADIRRIEKMIDIKIAPKANGQSVKKAVAKKKVKK